MGFASGRHGIAFFGDGLGQSFTRLLRLNLDPVQGAVGLHFGGAVELSHGTHHGFFTMFTSHAGHGKNLLHFKSLENTEKNKTRIVTLQPG